MGTIQQGFYNDCFTLISTNNYRPLVCWPPFIIRIYHQLFKLFWFKDNKNCLLKVIFISNLNEPHFTLRHVFYLDNNMNLYKISEIDGLWTDCIRKWLIKSCPTNNSVTLNKDPITFHVQQCRIPVLLLLPCAPGTGEKRCAISTSSHFALCWSYKADIPFMKVSLVNVKLNNTSWKIIRCFN